MRERYEIIKAMHEIVRAMNDENAYFRWIYLVPDEASDADLMDVATDEELFRESCVLFRDLIADYGDSGFYVAESVY